MYLIQIKHSQGINKDEENLDYDCIKNKKTIVHLTALENIDNIFYEKKLLSRAKVIPKVDVADEKIIEKRKKDKLEDYVPFHFFMKNPFDGAVIKNYPCREFIYLAVKRDTARKNNFLIIPKHPLSDDEDVNLLPYDEGFRKIDWTLMEKRDYQDKDCKHTCMAECLALFEVPLSMVCFIAVQSETAKQRIEELKNKYPYVYNGYIDLKPEYFPKP